MAQGVLRRRTIRRELDAARPLPLDAVEVKPRWSRLAGLGTFLVWLTILLGFAWLWHPLLDDPYAAGLIFVAVISGASEVGDLFSDRAIRVWERRNGRVFVPIARREEQRDGLYVERGTGAPG